MKAILSTILLAVACGVFAGCETDVPPDPNRDPALQRAITGQGTLVQPDKSDDPVIRENTRVGY